MRIFALSIIILLKACSENEVGAEKGRALSTKYCSSCHIYPEPGLLPKDIWTENVLPDMGPRLGIFTHNGKKYPNRKFDHPDYYPGEQLLSSEDWQLILDYYRLAAPEKLEVPRSFAIIPDSTLFQVTSPEIRFSDPATGYIQIDPTNNEIFVSDTRTKSIYRYSSSLNLLDSVRASGPILALERGDDAEKDFDYFALNAGELNPSDAAQGSILKLKWPQKQQPSTSSTIAWNLVRPVHLSVVDLLRDGFSDLVVCEFGNLKGSLSLYMFDGKSYQRQVIEKLPGAISTEIRDVNNDGLPEIWVLFSQGNEGIFLYINKGNGTFEKREVMRFPPAWGSSSFDMVDFNSDGYEDIIYTCGDNADNSQVLKPYHGIYVFLNDGKLKFEQKHFFPVNGCFKAIARDFDKDGDTDIASLAFFPDYKSKPQESFLYFQNNGNEIFEAHHPGGTDSGRWITMDAADLDGDGYDDIVLANFSIVPSFIPSVVDWSKGPPFILLRNKRVK